MNLRCLIRHATLTTTTKFPPQFSSKILKCNYKFLGPGQWEHSDEATRKDGQDWPISVDVAASLKKQLLSKYDALQRIQTLVSDIASV